MVTKFATHDQIKQTHQQGFLPRLLPVKGNVDITDTISSALVCAENQFQYLDPAIWPLPKGAFTGYPV